MRTTWRKFGGRIVAVLIGAAVIAVIGLSALAYPRLSAVPASQTSKPRKSRRCPEATSAR
jgi:hypothetical protein